MGTKQQTRMGLTSIGLLIIVMIATLMVSNLLFKGWRLDLTENKLYTISDGTKNILSSIDEGVNLYFFFSDEGTADVQVLRSYATRVREMLEQFAEQSGGKVSLSVIDPVPFSEEEDQAAEYGLQGIRLGPLSESIYLGLAGTNSVGDQEIIPFFDPSREAFLEYELAKFIFRLANPDRTVVGLISGVEMTMGFDPQTQQMREPWVVVGQAQQLFEVRSLGADVSRIEDEIDVLWIVHPKEVSDQTLYAIDQHILKKGKALIFVDPLAEIDVAGPPGDPSAMFSAQGSSLGRLFEAWELEFSAQEAVADNRYGLTVSPGMGQRPVRHIGLLGVGSESLDADDVTTADLSSINFGSTGYFSTNDGSPLEFLPLITSSQDAATLPVDQFRFLPNPETLLDEFAATGETYVLAARVNGNLETAFPDGPPQPQSDDETAQEPTEHLTESVAPANLILVGDVDVLGDRLWVQVQNFFGQRIPNAFANNGDFVINALDNLSGSADLIGIRSRATSSRPFTTVEALRREADAQYRATEQRLQAELSETEQRLSELQSSRPDDDNPMMLSADQESEIQRFLTQRARIRKELRGVQRELDKNIDDLGSVLKAINIGLVPLLLTLFAIFIIWSKRGGRRQ